MERQKAMDNEEAFETSHSMKRLIEKLHGGLSSGENSEMIARSIKNQIKINYNKIMNLLCEDLILEMIPILDQKELH